MEEVENAAQSLQLGLIATTIIMKALTSYNLGKKAF